MKTLLLMCLVALSYGGIDDAILVVSGASCIEELSEDAVSMFVHLAEHPIDLNSASERRLTSCGLMSEYQAASLCDYRRRSGDILSWHELALVDGFGSRYADALSYFAVLRSRSAPGETASGGFRGDVTLSTGASFSKTNQAPKWKYGIKTDMELGGKYELMWNTRTTFSSPSLDFGTVSMAAEGRRWKLVLGHFNARFGQGLVSWSGFMLGGFSAISAFSRSGSGITSTSSASAELLGIAGTMYAGRSEVNAGISFATKDAVLNYSFYRHRFNVGITASTHAASVSEQVSWKHLSVFSESAWHYSYGPAVVMGALWVPHYGVSLALNTRFYDRKWNEYSGVALGIEGRGIFMSVDYSSCQAREKRRLKFLMTAGKEFAVGPWALNLVFRSSISRLFQDDERVKVDLRLDLKSHCGPYHVNSRVNILFYNSLAWLAYIEPGMVLDTFSAYLRITGFDAKQWSDRLYCYERNAPGCFSIPAYYGNGVNMSAYIAVKPGRNASWNRRSLWLRLEHVMYLDGPVSRQDVSGCTLQYKRVF